MTNFQRKLRHTPILRQTMKDFVRSKKSVVRVCAAKRSNESPSGVFKRPNGLAQQDGGASPRQVPVCVKIGRVVDECRPTAQHPGTAGRTGLAALQQALGICTDGAEWRDGTLPLPWLRTRQIRGLTLHRSNNSPALVKKKPKRGCIDEGKMKGISGYRFSSNCSTVTVALPSAAKVMPSADWGV